MRIAFTGGDHYRYLAALPEIVVVGQGPSSDPPADNRAEDPGLDGRSLIGRPVMKWLKWLSEVPAWFGGWAFAAHPPGHDRSDSRWLFLVKYKDGDYEELELEELETILQPADPPQQVHLFRKSELKKLRKH